MILSKKSHEGYLLVDHRASPGLPEDIAVKAGLDPRMTSEGKVYESATIGCCHCGGVVIKNPLRVRDRAHCVQCDKYICDWCDLARSKPDYIHRSFDELSDLVTSGRFTISGSMSNPTLTPTGDHHGKALISGG